MPAKTPLPVWWIGLVLPCIRLWARITSPPIAWPIDWWPRQTPRIGRSSGAPLISARQMPASLGVQGPGDSTTASGRMASASWAVSASLR